MKRNSNKRAGVVLVIDNTPIPFQGDFYDTAISGDLDTSEQIYLNQGDLEDAAGEGAPLGKMVAKAMRTKAAKTPAATIEAKKAKDGARSLPGVGLMGVSIPPLTIQNAKVIQAGSNQTISGNLLKFNIDESPIRNPFLSVSKQVAGNANPGVEVNVTFNDGDKPAGCLIFSSPIIFITIASSQLNARTGNRYTVKVTGLSRDGVTITNDSWQLERMASDKPIRILYIPYIRQKDTIVPVAGGFGDIGGIAQNEALVVSISGMPDTESMQVVMPGLDSSEYMDFLASWGLSIK